MLLSLPPNQQSAFGTIQGENGKVTFVSNRDGNNEIYIMNADDGSGQTRLTNNAAHDGFPSLSPDGEKVAFESNRDGNSVASKTTGGAIPDKTGTQPLRIGANSRSLSGFFVGAADEVRVWNREVSSSEVLSQYNSGTFDTNGQVVYLPFSSTTVSTTSSNNPSMIEVLSQYNSGTFDTTTTTTGQVVYLLPPSSFTNNNINNPYISIVSASPTTANGGGGNNNNNNPPTANAGPDQTVHEHDLVTLDGSRSTDSDGGTIASYTWKQTAGPSVELNTDRPAQPTFIVPQVSQDTTLTFSLVVTDNNGASSAPDTVNILVKNRPANIPPKAKAGPDQTVNEGTTVTLDGSASTDRDGSIEYYQWTQTAGPLVALNEIDEGVAPQKATFTAPNVGTNGATTTLTFRLTVFDSDGATGRDTVNVRVKMVDRMQLN
jgi:hypothetical protein